MNACWTIECLKTIYQEYGCEIRGDCEIQFAQKLFQVRNPFRIVESLMVKFCDNQPKPRHLGHVPQVGIVNVSAKDSKETVESVIHAPFLIFAQALFGKDRDTLDGGRSFLTDTCLEATSFFVLQYHTILLDALASGFFDGMFHIEKSSVCDVIEMAGFKNASKLIHSPHLDIVNRVCSEDSSHDAMSVIPHQTNLVNVDRKVRLGWENLREIGLEVEYRNLFHRLGYSADQEAQVGSIPLSVMGPV